MPNPDDDPILERVRALRIEAEGLVPELRKDVVPPDLQDLLEQAEVLGATDDEMRARVAEAVPESYLDTLRGRVRGCMQQILYWPDASEYQLEHQVFLALIELVDETEPLSTPVPSIAEQNRRKLPEGDAQRLLESANRAFNRKSGNS